MKEKELIDEFLKDNFRWVGVIQLLGIITVFISPFSFIWLDFMTSLKIFSTGLFITFLAYFIYKIIISLITPEIKKMVESEKEDNKDNRSSFQKKLSEALELQAKRWRKQ